MFLDGTLDNSLELGNSIIQLLQLGAPDDRVLGRLWLLA